MKRRGAARFHQKLPEVWESWRAGPEGIFPLPGGRGLPEPPCPARSLQAAGAADACRCKSWLPPDCHPALPGFQPPPCARGGDALRQEGMSGPASISPIFCSQSQGASSVYCDSLHSAVLRVAGGTHRNQVLHYSNIHMTVSRLPRTLGGGGCSPGLGLAVTSPAPAPVPEDPQSSLKPPPAAAASLQRATPPPA